MRITGMQYPIIILAKERPRQLRDMIDAIERYTAPESYRLIICDNGSTSNDMLEYLRSLWSRYLVIYNEENLGMRGFNSGLEKVDTERFLLSDPDILLGQQTPSTWLMDLSAILDEVATPKAGLALSIDFGVDTAFAQRVYNCEHGYWQHVLRVRAVDDACYLAPIDTTMAMYRRDTYTFWSDGRLAFDEGKGLVGPWISQDDYAPQYKGWHGLPISFRHTACLRVAGRYTAYHTGWDIGNTYAEDWRYYIDHCDMQLASTTKYQRDAGWI